MNGGVTGFFSTNVVFVVDVVIFYHIRMRRRFIGVGYMLKEMESQEETQRVRERERERERESERER